MAEYTLNARVRHARKPEATWTSENPVLLQDEIGFVKETGRFKIGDGTTAWNSLSYATVDPIAHSAALITSGTLSSNRLPTVPVSKGGTGATSLTSGQALIGNGTGAVTTRAITNITAKGALAWTSDIGGNLINLNTLAYWNGAYSGTSSNLSYCNRGAFGTIVTKAAGDYLAVGGTAAAAKKLVANATISTYSNIVPSDYIADGGVVGLHNSNASDSNGYPAANSSGAILFGKTNAGVLMAARAGQTIPTIYVKQYYQSWGDWALLLHSSNYTSYTVKKDGTGATGTWGISISGNAATASSATKVANALSINGKSFNGSAAINVGTIGIGYGGTGATTTKEASYNLFNNMNSATSAMTDATIFVFKYASPSTTNGSMYTRTASYVWTYIKGKISSDLGLTASSYGGNAATATNADKLDGYHVNNIYNGFKHTIANANTTNTHVCIATITISGTSLSIAGFTAIFSNRECLDNSSFILTLALRRNSTSADGTGCEFYYMPIQGNVPKEIFIRSDDGVTFKVYFTSVAGSWTTYYNVTPLMTEGTVSFSSTGVTSSGILSGTVLKTSASIGGVVKSAATLTTARNINGTSFNGSADITTANWGTARTLTIGNTGKSVNGSAAVSWSLAEIGAAPTSGSNNYVRVYNSKNIGNSSEVTVNDLAKQHAAVAMIYAATDNPTGASKWVHVWNQSWNNGVNTSWVSQIALGVGNSNGMWYRTSSGTIVGTAWKRILDSSNYNSYALPLSGGTMNAGAQILIPEKSGSLGTAHIKIYDNSNYGLRMDAEAIQIWSGAAEVWDATSFSEIFSGYIYTSGYLQAGTSLTTGTTATIGTTLTVKSNAYFKAATNYFYNGSYYTAINRPSASANYTLYLPSATGQLVYHTNDTAIGDAAKPVYIAASGAATACSSTVGSTSKPVYMKAGTITALSATVGSSSRPMYSNAGTLTAITAVSTSYGGTGATTVDGALTNLNAVGVYGRSSISTTINLDNPGVNGFFELRGTSEVTVSGTRPSSSWIPFLSLKSPDNIVMLQLAGSGASFYLRGKQAGSVTLSDVAWQTILVSGNYTDYVVPKTGGTFSGTVKFGSQLHLWSDGEGGNIRLFTKTSTTNCFEFDGYDGNLRLYYSTNSGSAASTSWSWKTNGLFMTPYLGVNGNNTSYRLYVVGTSYLSSTVTSASEFISTSANGFRITQGNYGAFFRNDGGAFYLLFTASGSQTGSWNSLRPFTANLSNGYVTIGNGLGVGAADTGYTFNVTGTSRFSGKMTLFGSINASNANAPFNGAIEIREAGLVTTSQSAITYAPKIGFHWGGRVASALALHSDNYFYRISNGGGSYKIVDAACFSLSGTTLTITV